MLDYLFADEQGVRPVHRVTAGCDIRNTHSAALLERVGMRREGHLVESEWFKGEWTSEYRYALLRREWLHAQRPTPGSQPGQDGISPGPG